MGINIPTREELIANKLDPHQLADAVGKTSGTLTLFFRRLILYNHSLKLHFTLLITGADSLVYLSIEGLISAVTYQIREKDPKKIGHCIACLSGQYPEKLEW